MHTKLKAVVVRHSCKKRECRYRSTPANDPTQPTAATMTVVNETSPLKIIVVGYYWQLGSKQMYFIKHYISLKHLYIYSDNLQTKWNAHQHTQHIIPLTNHHIIRLVHFHVAISNMHWLPTIVMAKAVLPTVAPYVVTMPIRGATSVDKAITTTTVCSQWDNILRHHE